MIRGNWTDGECSEQITVLIIAEQGNGFANDIRVQDGDFRRTSYYRYDAFGVEHVGRDDSGDWLPADHPIRASLMAEKRAELDAAGDGVY